MHSGAAAAAVACEAVNTRVHTGDGYVRVMVYVHLRVYVRVRVRMHVMVRTHMSMRMHVPVHERVHMHMDVPAVRRAQTQGWRFVGPEPSESVHVCGVRWGAGWPLAAQCANVCGRCSASASVCVCGTAARAHAACASGLPSAACMPGGTARAVGVATGALPP